MNRIKCATFNKEMQDSIPQEIREKMKADRAKAEKEHETKAKTLPIQCVSGSTSDEYRKCANCGKEMNMTKKEYITLMDRGMHRYVCTSKCMLEYYR